MPSEAQIISGCKRKRESSQKILFECFYPHMMAICLRYANNHDQAKDMLQEGFIKVFDNIKGFNEHSSLKTWMTRIFINNAINHLKKEAKFIALSFDDAIEAGELNDDLYFDEDYFEALPAAQVIEKMQLLPTGYRTILNLYAIEGCTHKEIAEQLSISEGTSKSQLSKARKMLKSLLNITLHEKAG